MKLGFFGADRGVTGSNHLVEFGETKVLLDCGMYQCGKFCEIENHKPFVYDPASIAAVFVSHPHADHCGKLPKLYKDGFRGKVYCTAPARKLAQVVLEDSAKCLATPATARPKPTTSSSSIHSTAHLFSSAQKIAPSTMIER